MTNLEKPQTQIQKTNTKTIVVLKLSVSAFTVVARCHMNLFRDKSIWITPGIVGVAYKERKLCVSE